MASKGATAALMDTSLKRLRTAIDSVSQSTGIAAVEIPEHNRDGELLRAYQLEAMANWVEKLVELFVPAQYEVTDAEGGIIVPESTANSLVGLVETIVLDAGLEWETVDFTENAEIDPVTHVEQQLVKAMRAKGLIPEQEGEVVMKYVDEDGNPTDENGNPLDVTGSQGPVTPPTEDEAADQPPDAESKKKPTPPRAAKSKKGD